MAEQIETQAASTVAFESHGETPTGAWIKSIAAGAIPVVPGYEILGELGRGGMGVVYKARQKAIQRIVALKMVLDSESADVEFDARFRAEAEAAARLQHPNIVQLYEFGEANGRPYFSLEFVGGGSLADRLNGEPQAFDATADLIATLADAMHYAHSLGVVHRDLKPANILMTETAVPKIADFGLAKRLDSIQGHTVTGAVLGTPSYMPPEQATGQTSRIGPPADIYALGAILYECLTGRPPFRGGTPYETILQVAHFDPVPPRQLRRETPRDLETICLKCLAKAPSRRYATARELAEDLRRFREREPIAARPPTVFERFRLWVRRHPARAAAMITISCAAAFLLALGIRHNVILSQAFEQVQSERQIAHRQLVRATLANGWRLADEGDFIESLPYFVEALRLDLGTEHETTHRTRIGAVLRLCPELLQVWSLDAPVIDAVIRPDGRAAAILRDDGSIRLRKFEQPDETAKAFHASRSGHAVQFPSPRRRLLSFDPAGRWLIVTASDRVYCVDTNHPGIVVDIGGGGAAVAWLKSIPFMLFSQAELLSTWNPNSPHALAPGKPNGSAITAIAAADVGDPFATGHSDGTIRIWNRSDWKSTELTATFSGPISHLHFRPDGRRLLIVAGAVAQVFDVTKNQLVGLPMRHAQEINDAAWSPNGSTIATGSTDDTARLWNAETGHPIADPLKHGSDVDRVAFSPDGQLLATSGDDDMARVWNVKTGLAHTPPLPHAGSTTAISFGTDNRTLLSASEDGTVKLWRVEPPIDEAPVQPIAADLPRRIAMGGDGRHELISSDGKEYRVYDGAEKRWVSLPIAHAGGMTAIDVNPSGQLIATAGNDRTARIWDGQTGRELAVPMRHGSRVVDVAFSPDGLYVGTASDDNSARVWSATTGDPVTPPLWHNGGVRHIRFSPDSKFVLTASKGALAYVWQVPTGEEVAPVRTRETWVQAALRSRRTTTPWKLDLDRRAVEELQRVARWLSAQTMDSQGSLSPLSANEWEQLAPLMRK